MGFAYDETAAQTTVLFRFPARSLHADHCRPDPRREGGFVGAVLVFHDVSRERRMRRLLSYQAAHDPLTGLINRREFENRLHTSLEQSREDPSLRHVMLYVDLDQFKVVNDTCGHPAGDELLRQVTGLLQTRIRTADVLARLGGDEFGILLQNCTPETAMRIAEGVRQAIRDFRFTCQGNVMQIGASIGLVELTSRTESVAALLSAADVACYSAKDGGRNRVYIYDPESASARHREMRWVSRINEALEQNRLTLFAPAIQATTRSETDVDHYELLLRMYDERGELINPGSFIPAAERYKLMYEIDRWVIKQAFSHCSRINEAVGDPLFTINLSGISLNQDGLLEYIREQFRATGADPQSFCFEVRRTFSTIVRTRRWTDGSPAGRLSSSAATARALEEWMITMSIGLSTFTIHHDVREAHEARRKDGSSCSSWSSFSS